MRSFVIPGRLPSLNETIDVSRGDKYAAGREKAKYTEMVAWIARAAKIRKMNRVDLYVTWYEETRKRDPDNIHAGVKFILDGLVVAGVIKNDGQRYVGNITHTVRLDRDNPRVEVEIMEAEEGFSC